MIALVARMGMDGVGHTGPCMRTVVAYKSIVDLLGLIYLNNLRSANHCLILRNVIGFLTVLLNFVAT